MVLGHKAGFPYGLQPMEFRTVTSADYSDGGTHLELSLVPEHKHKTTHRSFH